VRKIRVPQLQHGVACFMVGSAILTRFITSVSDRKTDRHHATELSIVAIIATRSKPTANVSCSTHGPSYHNVRRP